MTHLLILTLRWVRSRSRPLGAMVLLALATGAGPASAQHAGLRTWVVPGNEPITVALFYPTDTPARVVSMGPWQPVVALGATVARAPLKGLILVSHGTGGHELGHYFLATRLAAADPRIRAVVALAPMAVVFTPESLKALSVPVRLIVAEHDAVLTRKYHGGWVAANLASAQFSTVPGAGHFAFMAQPTQSLPSDAGDAAANPAGFDRVAYHAMLQEQVVQFFGQQWR